MATFHMPRLRLQDQSQLGEDCYHSFWISLVRGMAALQVAAAHLRAEVFPGLSQLADPPLLYQGFAFVTGFAHQAVVLFFLISGWLVGGSLLNKMSQPGALASYTIDRVTRLWTVLVPTFLLMLLLGLGTGQLHPRTLDFAPHNEYSALTLLGNLVGLQTIAVSNFGGNYALWSLANETWYYILFPLVLLVFSARATVTRLASAIAVIAIALALPFHITLYFAVWMLGVGFSRLRLECGWGLRIVLLIVLAVVSVYYRLYGRNDDAGPASFVQDLVCSLPFLLLLSSAQGKISPSSKLVPALAPVARFFSDFSFTLYVLHLPLIGLLKFTTRGLRGTDRLSPYALLDYGIYLLILVAILAGAYVSYRLFESQTYRIRRWAKHLLLDRQQKAVAAASVSR